MKRTRIIWDSYKAAVANFRHTAGTDTLLCMNAPHPINQTLLAVVDNQVVRTDAVFEDLREDVLRFEPGGDCNSILGIGRHLLVLRRFQMTLLQSPLAERIDDPETVDGVDELKSRLATATDFLRTAISEHDPEDWHADPPSGVPRPGPWSNEPTLQRFVRPLNDFANHLGAIRAIRRSQGNPAERTQ